MENRHFDEVDGRLLHALQIEPRASWEDLAPVVGVDAATLARRWTRLSQTGVAWSTGYRPAGQIALLELECEHGRLDSVTAELCADVETAVIDHSSGSRDLLALVVTDNLEAMSAYSVDRLGQVEGIRAVRTHLASELLMEARNWRLRALSPAEVDRIPPPRRPRARAAKTIPPELEESIVGALRLDGRCSYTAIAERSGFSPQRVSDAIAAMRAHGELVFRTDIARRYSDWPIYAWYFVEVPSKVVELARRRVVTVPEVRLAALTASRYNLILAVWLRRLTDITRLEVALTAALEGSRIADRAVVLRTAKHLGRIIGPDGRALPPQVT